MKELLASQHTDLILRRWGSRLLGALLLMGLLIPAHAARFFRYEDENGVVVLSHTIPNERVKYGYEIVDETSRVLQVIAPQLSEEAYREKMAYEAAVEKCNAAVSRVRGLYRSVEDIHYAEVKAIESLDTQINNLKANLSHIKNQREDLEGQAAQMDIAGRQISKSLLEAIDAAKAQEANLADQIRARETEKLEVVEAYDFDQAVFELENCDQGLPAPRLETAARATSDAVAN